LLVLNEDLILRHDIRETLAELGLNKLLYGVDDVEISGVCLVNDFLIGSLLNSSLLDLRDFLPEVPSF
jgi:hypothetical protein